MFKKILLAIITIASINFSQTIHDLIQPINLSQDQPTIVMVSDIFYNNFKCHYDIFLHTNRKTEKNKLICLDNSIVGIDKIFLWKT